MWVCFTLINWLQLFNKYSSGFASQEGENLYQISVHIVRTCRSVWCGFLCNMTDVRKEMLFDPDTSACSFPIAV